MLLILIWHAKSSDNKLYIKIELMNKCSAQPFLNSNALFSFYLGVRSFFSSQHWNFCARRQYDTLYICNWQFVYYTAKETPLSKLTNSTYYDANFVCTVRFIMIFLYCMRKNQFVEKSKKKHFSLFMYEYELWSMVHFSGIIRIRVVSCWNRKKHQIYDKHILYAHTSTTSRSQELLIDKYTKEEYHKTVVESLYYVPEMYIRLCSDICTLM